VKGVTDIRAMRMTKSSKTANDREQGEVLSGTCLRSCQSRTLNLIMDMEGSREKA
jgi:hypothetical protein